MPLQKLSQSELKKIRAVFFDIDDTFSSHGQIHSGPYSALWQLRESGVMLIPVTGRPAGWCDMIARFWPVTAVIGENGAFYARMVKKRGQLKLEKTYLESASTRLANAKRLLSLKKKLLTRYAGLSFASDQLFREFDLAIDYCEDVKPWPQARVQDLLDYCSAQGAQAKLSSIHVNIWYGKYDKNSCVEKLYKDLLGTPGAMATGYHGACYLGDSPNDEPLFSRFDLSIGVANVRRFLPSMKTPPRYICNREAGDGFVEFAKRLVAARKK